VPSVAVDVARCIFSDFSRKSVLVVGAGDMAQLVCQYLRQAKVERFVVTSRTLANARALANACDGVAVPYDQLETQLDQADIVITATACPKVIFTTERVQAVQKRRGHRPLFFLDLAVPRDVDPGIEKLQEVYLYDVDALGRVVAENQEHRQGQTEACERILDEEMAAFETWLNENRAGPMIRQMFDDAHDLCEAELVRLFEACPDLTKPQQEAVAQLADRLINKLMHPCVQTMRRHSLSASSTTLADALHRVATRHRVGRTQA
jgi:glutamyl-tRNA reductase